MKTITVSIDKTKPQTILIYDNEIMPDELAVTVYTMLEIVSEQAGLKLKYDLYEICEEIRNEQFNNAPTGGVA